MGAASSTVIGTIIGTLALGASAIGLADPGLAPVEQQITNDLAGVGLIPTEGDRVMVNTGYRIRSVLSTGKTRDYVVQNVYGSIEGSHLDQAQVMVDSAIRNLCPASASAPQQGPAAGLDDPFRHPCLSNTPPLMRPPASPNGPGSGP